MKQQIWIGLMVALVSQVVLADAAPAPPNGVWSGKGQLGFVDTQGNTQSKTANAMLDAGYLDAPWKHALHLEALYGQSSGYTAAERWAGLWQSNYALTPRLFVFGALSYDYDLFSGFQYQGSVSAGPGYNIFDSKVTQLSVQLGAGYRRLRPELLVKNSAGIVIGRVLEPASSGAIGTAGISYSQALTSTTTLSDKMAVEAGSANTLLTNALALTVKITNRLALSIGYNLQDNTSPPAGLKKLDTIETVNLVFGF